jgi:hypothetical protein
MLLGWVGVCLSCSVLSLCICCPDGVFGGCVAAQYCVIDFCDLSRVHEICRFRVVMLWFFVLVGFGRVICWALSMLVDWLLCGRKK